MTINSDISSLHPKFQGTVKRLQQYLIDAYETGRTKTRFELFEGFRDPVRQASMLAKGTSKAGPFQSAHQLGLAVDFVPHLSVEDAKLFNSVNKLFGDKAVGAGWSWHPLHDYEYLRLIATTQFQLVLPVFAWDKCHIEHPSFPHVRSAMKKYLE